MTTETYIEKWEKKIEALERENFHSAIGLVEDFLSDLRAIRAFEKKRIYDSNAASATWD